MQDEKNRGKDTCCAVASQKGTKGGKLSDFQEPFAWYFC